MRLQPVFKRIVPFVIAMAIGIFAAGLFMAGESLGPSTDVPRDKQCFGHGHPLRCKDILTPQSVLVDSEMGDSVPAPETSKPQCPGTCGLKILSKPRANFTDLARQNNIQGDVTLRITFLATGKIGAVIPVKTLPYGLTEQAIAAARNIRFEPAAKNGMPYSMTRTVRYSFSIY